MAQKSKNKKSLIQTTLKQERKAAIRDPEGKKSVLDKTAMLAELASYGIPIGTAAALTTKGVSKLLTIYKNYQKVQNTPSIALYRGEPVYKTFTQTRKKLKKNPNTGKFFTTKKDIALQYSKQPLKPFSKGPNKFGVIKEVKVSPNEFKAMKKGKLKDTQRNRGELRNFDKDFFYGTVTPEVRRRAKVIPKAAGGVVKKRTNVTKSDNKYDTSSKKKWVRR